uniref:MocR-like transcription factor YczR n=1 Tax=Pseudactinotalea sp. TaxID=1926260 RepID=UPI003B3BD68D
MATTISPHRLAAVLGEFDRDPAYLGLANALRLLVIDGRLPHGTKLPSERALAAALDVSRTTATRAYAILGERGYARARHGSGTYAHLPAARHPARDRILMPRLDADHIDLGSAANSAPPGVAEALVAAAQDAVPYLGGHGYFPGGIPALQEAIAAHFEARGLPTGPDQILVTPGALSAAAIVMHALTGRGDRVLIEDPAYPNIPRALRGGGARLVPNPLDIDGWDLEATAAVVHRSKARAAYLVPDFQNPTGHLMTGEQRERYAAALAAADTIPVVDEAAQQLLLDEGEMPPPFAVFHPQTITLGSASKIYWGGLRLGWIRAPRPLMDRLVRTRIGLDLGTPVLDQLALARLLTDGAEVRAAHRERLREQREALLSALAEHLPEWHVPRAPGGLSAWCQLPTPVASALCASAEEHGVVIAPGSVFAVDGRMESFVRIPWIRPPAQMHE